jgi:hypothetical protein
LTKLEKTFYQDILQELPKVRMNLLSKLLGLFLTLSFPVICELEVNNHDECCFKNCTSFSEKLTKGLQLYVGPEIYHVHRTREGGAKQDGMLYGIRAGYDRIKRYKIYYGFDALYASGILDGKGGSGQCLESKFSDALVEGRLGYTLKSKCRYKPSFTPYVGVGYFIEKNNFTHPKETPIHFRTSFLFAAVGFLSQITITDKFDIGFNFKARFPYDATCRVSHDPNEDNSKQVINEKFQYRAELPLTYKFFDCDDHLRLSFVPFYEFRQYGHHPNFPADFLETKLNIYGLQLKIMYCL